MSPSQRSETPVILPSASRVCSGTGAPTKLARWRASLSRSAASASRICAGEGRARARGSSGHSAAAVATETRAVAALTAPSTRYNGNQSVRRSAQCPAPHSRMKAANRPNTGLKARSRRRRTKRSSATGMEK